MKTHLEFVKDAQNGDPAWVFHHSMTQEDRDAFDAWLVKSKHPCAYRAGTQESRFRWIVESRKVEG